ncbi:MAG: winged helix-turn-helix transcriptional regulator [Nitrososphaerota archaeon]
MTVPQQRSMLTPPVFRCKHTIPILSAMRGSALRFSELERRLGVKPSVLVRKLWLLQREGLVRADGGKYMLTETGEQITRLLTPIVSEVSLQALAEVLKCKWSKEILTSLLKGPRYSVELVNSLDGLSWKVASERLRKLQKHGLVAKTVQAETTPVRVVYSLTRKGKLLAWWLLSAGLIVQPQTT